MKKEIIANKWCKNHNAILIKCCKDGFYYMNSYGDWYISFSEVR